MNFESVSLDDLSRLVHEVNHDELLSQTKHLVDKEREMTVKTLVLFREIEKRMIHLELGFGSLFDMLVHHFGLSEGSASRRVAGVRLMSQVPEVEKKIRDGDLSLSNAAAAQRFFRAEAKNQKPLGLEEKKEVLESLVGKSSREGEKELIQRSSLPIALQVPDQVRPKGDAHVEIRFLAPQALTALLDEARGLLAHRLPAGASMADLIQALAELGVERVKKERFGVGKRSRGVGVIEGSVAGEGHSSKVGSASAIDSRGEVVEYGEAVGDEGCVGADVFVDRVGNRGEVVEGDGFSVVEGVHIGADVFGEVPYNGCSKVRARTRYIPMPIRRAVYLRAEGRCEYRDSATGQRCESVSFLELDHRVAFAKGGAHTVEGILLACWSHNKLRAVRDFGVAWMGQFKRAG